MADAFGNNRSMVVISLLLRRGDRGGSAASAFQLVQVGGYYKLFLAKYEGNSWTFQSLAVVVASFVTFFFNLHNITDRVMANLILIVVLTQIQSTVNLVGFDFEVSYPPRRQFT